MGLKLGLQGLGQASWPILIQALHGETIGLQIAFKKWAFRMKISNRSAQLQAAFVSQFHPDSVQIEKIFRPIIGDGCIGPRKAGAFTAAGHCDPATNRQHIKIKLGQYLTFPATAPATSHCAQIGQCGGEAGNKI